MKKLTLTAVLLLSVPMFAWAQNADHVYHGEGYVFAAYEATVGAAATHLPDNANWNNLRQLAPGSEIKVVLSNKKSYRGKFQSLSDEAIIVRLGHGEQSFDRQNVLRVSARGKSHRLRNTLIGTAIGAGGGFAFGAAADTGDFSFHFAARNSGKEIFIPSFAVVGALVGTALPTRRWHDLYRAR